MGMNRETSELELQSALSERYTDFSKVGEGGMAVVFKAHDSVLLRDVAIKTLRIKNMTPDMVARFQREARTAGKLQHPNLVTVLDFGMSQQIPYLIMDYACGETLASAIGRCNKFGFREVVELACEVCRGMAFAHANGVVHRDLKPGNIVILAHPEPDARVKIVDFGIARIVQSLAGDTEYGVVTAAHYIDGRISNSQLVGSPFYMSPEQIRGEDIDARSDIYSFGCTLYQMLTGRVPFRGDTKLETFRLHLNEAPPPISEPGVPKQLCDLVAGCLAKKPEERPASMAEISSRLSKCLEDSERVVEPSEGDGSKRPSSTNSTKGLVVLSAVIALLFVGAICTNVIRDNPKRPPSKAEIKAKLVKKVTERKWDHEDKNGAKVWVAEANLTDDELITVIENNARFVKLKQSNITNDGLASLATVPIEELDLSMTKVNDASAPYLSRLKKLRQLTLTYTQFTDEGLAQLQLPNLLHIDLDGLKGVTDVGLETIINKWPDLTYLNVSNTSVSSKGLRKLTRFHKLTGLEVAELTLDDDAMELITSLPLTRLSLNSSRFPKKWLPKVTQMKNLSSLHISDVKGFSPEDYAFLQANIRPGAKLECVNLAGQQMDQVEDFAQLMK